MDFGRHRFLKCHHQEIELKFGRALLVFPKAKSSAKNKKVALSVTIFLSTPFVIRKNSTQRQKGYPLPSLTRFAKAEHLSSIHFSQFLSLFPSQLLSFYFYLDSCFLFQSLPNCQKTTIGKRIEKCTL